MAASFAEDVTAYAEAGVNAMEVWLTKLEEHLQKHSAEETSRLLADHQMHLAAASYQGGLLLSQGEARRSHYDHFQRRLGLCQESGIDTLVIVPDATERVDETGLERAHVSLCQASQLAASYGVRLALEFRARTWCASLDTAAALVASCRESNLGVALDAFHYYTGPSKPEDLRLLGHDTCGFVQVCDLSGVPRELAGDADRILPGDGDFLLEPILQHLAQAGYQGWVSVELMNPELWKMKPAAVANAAWNAVRRLLSRIKDKTPAVSSTAGA
jgi:sugar phosphate isomerase/epimerase